jgi:hypothetical protein
LLYFGNLLEPIVKNMAISEKKNSSEIKATLAHFFHKSPLYESLWMFFCCQVTKPPHGKKLLLGTAQLSYQSSHT